MYQSVLYYVYEPSIVSQLKQMSVSRRFSLYIYNVLSGSHVILKIACIYHLRQVTCIVNRFPSDVDIKVMFTLLLEWLKMRTGL